MTRTRDIEEFRPHDERIGLNDISAALADLDPIDTPLGISVRLRYTERADGTVDTIEIGPLGGTNNWVVYTGRAYRGGSFANITSTVGYCPGHMAILVVRALHSHLSTIGPQGRQQTYEGDILFALGLSRGEGVPQV